MPPKGATRRRFRPVSGSSGSKKSISSWFWLLIGMLFIFYAWSNSFWTSSSSSSSGDGEEGGEVRVHSSPLVMKEESKTAKEIMLQKPRDKQHQANIAANEVKTNSATRGGKSPLDSVDISGLSKLYVENMQNNDVHVIFSTDCNAFQDWQSLLVFHSAKQIGQKGPITRIASGCTPQQELYLKKLYRYLWPQYGVHFTPDFKKDPKTGRKYDFYNKPYGLQHFLSHHEPPLKDDVVIALIDPDQMFIRPIVAQVKGDKNNLISRPWKEGDIFEKVQTGKPAGQTYGLGAPWVNDNHKKFNRGKICGENSPCLDVPNEQEGGKHYSLGPPYMFTKVDGLKIARSWTTFVPRVYEGYPYLLAEMYAYSMAAAHEKLPHLRMDNWMVSNTEAGGEGWAWIDALDDPCMPPDDEGIFYKDKSMPTMLHFCQFYLAGDMAFGKRRITPHNLFTCEAPMLREPTSDLGKSEYQYTKKDGRVNEDKKQKMSRVQAKRNAFMICTTHRAINAALIDYKKRMCSDGKANYEKTVDLVDNSKQ